MRLLIPCHTGTTAVEIDQVKAALMPLGWLPSESNSEFVDAKRAEILERLPVEVQQELRGIDPILIEGQAGTWGLCSLEKQHTVTVRVLNPQADELQEFADRIVQDFARSLETQINGEVSFPEHIQIRKLENQETVGSGVIDRRPALRFREYLQQHRNRERRVLRVLTGLFIAAGLGSLVLFVFSGEEPGPIYARGWLDRLGSALLVAVLTTVLNLLFDFRSWRARRNKILWSFGEVHYASPD